MQMKPSGCHKPYNLSVMLISPCYPQVFRKILFQSFSGLQKGRVQSLPTRDPRSGKQGCPVEWRQNHCDNWILKNKKEGQGLSISTTTWRPWSWVSLLITGKSWTSWPSLSGPIREQRTRRKLPPRGAEGQTKVERHSADPPTWSSGLCTLLGILR